MEMRCEIVSKSLPDENGTLVDTFGIHIHTPLSTVKYEDLCTDYGRIEKLCSLLNEVKPELKIIPELLEDYIFSCQ